MLDLYAGFAKTDITPPLGTPLFGYPSYRPAKRVLDNLYVSATAIRQNDTTVIFMSADLAVLDNSFCEKLYKEIEKETGVTAKNITLTCTHTHSGPMPKDTPGWGEADTDYLENTLAKGALNAAKAAVDSLTPAVVGIGQTDCYAAVNRRQFKDGEIVLGQNPDGPFDPKMTAIVFKSPEGKYIATIIHYAMHGTCADGNTYSITRDWPSIMVNTVEVMTSAGCMYINGNEGDIGPRLSNGKTTADESQIAVIGSIAADSAVEAINSIEEYNIPELKIHSDNVYFPICEIMPYDELLKKIEDMGTPEEQEANNALLYNRLIKIKEMYEKNIPFEKALEVKQTVFALGDLALVPIPFEAFCNIALDLRAQSPFKETITLGMANGQFGYLPTEDELPKGGYEVGSFYGMAVPGFIESLDKEIVKENIRLLKQLKNK